MAIPQTPKPVYNQPRLPGWFVSLSLAVVVALNACGESLDGSVDRVQTATGF
jgi:hypothetical protein